MSLVPDYSSSSEDEISEKSSNYCRNTNLNKGKLPSADSLLSKEKPGEVFNNPYKEAEEAKIASLEKHVKMVDTGDYIKEKNGKKICWNYRKGRCRFGSSCSFAHDSDLSNTAIMGYSSTSSTDNINQKTSIISKPQQGLQLGSIVKNNQSPRGDDKVNKRNRPGLSDSIVPNKKVLKQYNLQKKKLP